MRSSEGSAGSSSLAREIRLQSEAHCPAPHIIGIASFFWSSTAGRQPWRTADKMAETQLLFLKETIVFKCTT